MVRGALPSAPHPTWVAALAAGDRGCAGELPSCALMEGSAPPESSHRAASTRLALTESRPDSGSSNSSTHPPAAPAVPAADSACRSARLPAAAPRAAPGPPLARAAPTSPALFAARRRARLAAAPRPKGRAGRRLQCERRPCARERAQSRCPPQARRAPRPSATASACEHERATARRRSRSAAARPPAGRNRSGASVPTGRATRRRVRRSHRCSRAPCAPPECPAASTCPRRNG
eukprot:scaffold11428_cov105-Isochrysis_galbana.AAC.3